MDQYERIFGTTRVARIGCDEIVVTAPHQSIHATVLINNHIYQLQLAEQQTLKPLSVELIYSNLLAIRNDAKSKYDKRFLCKNY
jgi:hypothetical protein